MRLDKKWYNVISFFVMVVFVIVAYRILSIVIQVELGSITMNNTLREELHSNLWYLSVVIITLLIRKKDNNRTPIKSEV